MTKATDTERYSKHAEPLDYPYLRAYCQMMNSASYHVEDQLKAARLIGAPQYTIAVVGGRARLNSELSAASRLTLERIAKDFK